MSLRAKCIVNMAIYLWLGALTLTVCAEAFPPAPGALTSTSWANGTKTRPTAADSLEPAPATPAAVAKIGAVLAPTGLESEPTISPNPQPSCKASCMIDLPSYTGYEWVSYIPTSTVTIATVSFIWDTLQPGNVRNETWIEYPQTDYSWTIPRRNVDGELLTILPIEGGPSGTSTTKITYPFGYEVYPRSLSWKGVLITENFGRSTCLSTDEMKVQPLPAPTPTAVASHLGKFVNKEDPIWGENYVLVPIVYAAPIELYRELWPLEPALTACHYESLFREPVVPTLYGISFVTTTTGNPTSPIKTCTNNAINCRVRHELTQMSLDGPEPGTINLVRPSSVNQLDGYLQGGNAIIDNDQADPTALPASSFIAAPSSNLPNQGGPSPVTLNNNNMIPNPVFQAPTPGPAAVRGGIVLTVGSRPVSIALYTPPAELLNNPGTGPPQPVLIFDGKSIASLGQKLSFDNIPVEFQAGDDGIIIALIGGNSAAGVPPRAVPLSAFPGAGLGIGPAIHAAGNIPIVMADMMEAGSPMYFSPITLDGGVTLTPKDDGTFVLPGGEEVRIGGPEVTVKAGPGNADDLVLSMAEDKDGGNVLIINGVSKTLGTKPTATNTIESAKATTGGMEEISTAMEVKKGTAPPEASGRIAGKGRIWIAVAGAVAVLMVIQ